MIGAVVDQDLEALLTDPDGDKTGRRLRTLADRLGLAVKGFAEIATLAGDRLRAVMIQAATGDPAEKTGGEAKSYRSHARDWFKSTAGGRELETKVFEMEIWPKLKRQLLPFCNAVHKAVDLPEVLDISQ